MVVPNGAESDTPTAAMKIDEPFDLLAHTPTCHLIGRGHYGKRRRGMKEEWRYTDSSRKPSTRSKC